MFSIDGVVFLTFLLTNLVLGLLSSRGIVNIKSYAIGDRDFSTPTLAAAIIALWVSGEFFVTIVTESYKEGLIFMSILIAEFLNLLFIGLFFAPRLKEFLGKISIAEAMGEMYGQKVRAITAIAGFVGVSGIIAIQLQIAGLLFEYALGISHYYGVIISGFIITLYSSLGGIKSVTFTDVVQFATFAVVIPLIAFILLDNLDSYDVIAEAVSNNPKFNLSLFNFDNPQIYFFISLFIWNLLPGFNPGIFQRISMARDVEQVRNSFLLATIAYFFLAAITCWIGVLVLSSHLDIENGDILKLMTIDYQWFWGFKGVIIAGIMAMIMSTVDSYINSNSILLIHDLKDALHVKFTKNKVNELVSTRICAAIIGTISILFALRGGNFLELMLWTSTCYMPIVTVPFVMSLFGFRSTGKSVFAGMVAGFVTVVIWELYITKYAAGVGGLIPSMFANLVALFGYHYLFKQEGGWVGIKDPSALIEIRNKRKERYKNFISGFYNFSLLDFLKKNTPKNDKVISLLGIMVMVVTFSGVITVPKAIHMQHQAFLNSSYIITLLFSSVLISYSLWQNAWRKTNILPITWNLTMFLVLICFSFLLVLISGFSEIQTILFMVNVLMISSITHWRLAMTMLSTGILVTLLFYKNYFPVFEILISFASLDFKIVYLLVLIMSVLVMFFKPKQEHLEATEAKVEDLKMEITHLDHEVDDLHDQVTHYSEKISDQEKEIERLGATAQKILNNVNHELRLPVGNVINFSEMLYKGLGKHSPEMLKELSDQVHKNTTRLSSMILNMLDLANLEVKKVNLDKTLVNLSEIVKTRVKTCRNIYLQGKPINFKLMIDPEIMISVDPNYIRQAIDNLVINAINFSEEGTIIVKLEKQKNSVQFTITDQGIGIPREEIFDIFTPFKMGSNTESKAEGRGVGLALCKSIVDAHDGKISASSKGEGAIFRFVLPF
jgi:Na+/proline symporter/signal transduction histidine kinase